MKIKSKYKIARRLGPAVFEKTQTQKYALRNGTKKGGFGGESRPKMLTDFGKALLEKQKARFTYIMNERQFSRYAEEAIAEKKKKPEDSMFEQLEMRLDNVVSRLGFAKTRLSARQVVSHGHITVNKKRVSIPSYKVAVGDVISIMPRSQKSKLFESLAERSKEQFIPQWLTFDLEKLEGKVVGTPKFTQSENAFDMPTILDFYKR